VTRAAAVSLQPRSPLRVALVQKHVRGFRVPIFRRLAAVDGVELTVVAGNAPGDRDALGFDCRVVTSVRLPFVRRQLFLYPGFVRDVLRRRYDVIVCEGSLRVATCALLGLLRPVLRTHVVWWSALYDPNRPAVEVPRGARGLLLRRILRNVDAFVAYSEAARGGARDFVDPVRTFVARNALDTDLLIEAETRWLEDAGRLARFRWENGLEGRDVVLFVGRLIRQKRLHDLLEVFRRVRDRCGDGKPLLAVVGRGADESRLRRAAEELGLGGDVRFFGEIRQLERVCPFFLSARVFVLPGSGGLAVYQALSHGVPTVATVADGTERDLIADGRNGYLVEVGDIEALTDRTIRILRSSAEEWTALSDEARQAARGRGHVAHMIAGLEQAIEFAAARPRGRAAA
jgi:glycosyltransferase involved in cell wall biosynthesis